MLVNKKAKNSEYDCQFEGRKGTIYPEELNESRNLDSVWPP